MDAPTIPPTPPNIQSPPPPTEPLSIWSLVLGIASFVMCLGPVAAIPAVICGHVSRGRVKQSGGAKQGEGMALAGLITGYVNLALVPIYIGILAAIALPVYTKVRENANMAKQASAEKQIYAACVQHAADHDDTLPARLDDLVPKYLEGSVLYFDHRPEIAFSLVHPGEKLASLDPNTLLIVSISKDKKGRTVNCHADGRVEIAPLSSLPER